MNLYLVTNTTAKIDQFDAMVVAATTPENAVKLHPAGVNGWQNEAITKVWTTDTTTALTCVHIGTAKRGTRTGILLASFNAG